MKNIKLIKAIFLLAFLLYINSDVNAQPNTKQRMSVYGKWTCVSQDYRGYQKFSIEQAKELEHSVFNVEKHRMYYSGVKFIDSCSYSTLKPVKMLKNNDQGSSFFYRYNDNEFSKIIKFAPVDDKGEWSCYNDCALLYLKEDTLINICGGYTLFFKKKYDNVREFNGIGTSTERFTLNCVNDGAREVRLSYEFFQDKDELSLEDQNGKRIFRTGVISTSGEQSIIIQVESYVKMLVLKIKSVTPTSRWKIRVEN